MARETLPEPNSQGQRNRGKTEESNCCVLVWCHPPSPSLLRLSCHPLLRRQPKPLILKRFTAGLLDLAVDLTQLAEPMVSAVSLPRRDCQQSREGIFGMPLVSRSLRSWRGGGHPCSRITTTASSLL
jgi:hypothetical protein